ncbi:chorismate-binding protein [Aquiluna borgnonia]|uniref:Anthranilate synthase component 1 n=1 Tax=Aquiluna borgnonia TaxID=2499157 RepID=A0A7D4TKF6_9MICO|nr:chorismate-binding protein [Aquiluna borgnonia]QKJ25292.1 chorismate-binding protein [Aquiluna borgnonia]
MLSFEQVSELSASYNVIPLTNKLFSGTETPLGIYQKLCGERPNTFLLESAEQGVWARYSFIGVRSRGQLIASETRAHWNSSEVATPEGTLPGEPLEALEYLQQAWKSAPAGFPLNSGLVGFVSWGAVNLLENLPAPKPRDYEIPLYAFNQFSELVVMDHKTAELILVSVIFVDDKDLHAKYLEATKNLENLEAELRKPTLSMISEPSWPSPNVVKRTEPKDFLDQVERAKHHVRLGDVFQVVISQRFDQVITADATEVYQAMRAVNPSPYMYLTRWEDQGGRFEIVGSSPEALVKVTDGKAITHPIAGSRPRGEDATADNALADELLNDAKERSEHLMLVDLARNDLLKVCEPQSLRVTEFMQIHRFSHIMHLVSTVEGQMRAGLGPVAALRATFPAGTLSGAPKPRALEIIHDLEPAYRGLFGGVVGYFDFEGNSDLAIAIRTALIRDGVAHVQAGAGIVLDSIPASEYAETEAKAAVVLKTVAAANAMHVES